MSPTPNILERRPISMSETREVLSCPHCRLVQFRTQNSACRRCYHPLDDHFQHPVCPVPCSIQSTTLIANHRLEAVQIVGKRVREIRKEQALSQSDLARRMKVPRTYLSKVETCKVVPTVGTLRRIASALNVDVHHLLYSREFLEVSQDEFLGEIAPLVSLLTPQQRAVILRAVRDAALRRNSAA